MILGGGEETAAEERGTALSPEAVGGGGVVCSCIVGRTGEDRNYLFRTGKCGNFKGVFGNGSIGPPFFQMFVERWTDDMEQYPYP